MAAKEIISKAIKEKRTAKKWTQAYLAKKLNVARTTVTDWENCRSLPVATLFVEVIKVLDLDVKKM